MIGPFRRSLLLPLNCPLLCFMFHSNLFAIKQMLLHHSLAFQMAHHPSASPPYFFGSFQSQLGWVKSASLCRELISSTTGPVARWVSSFSYSTPLICPLVVIDCTVYQLCVKNRVYLNKNRQNFEKNTFFKILTFYATCSVYHASQS